MTPWFALFSFINVWFLTFFFVLAFNTNPEPKPTFIDYIAAPKPLPWKKIIVINSALSLVLTSILALIIHAGLIPLHTMVDGL